METKPKYYDSTHNMEAKALSENAEILWAERPNDSSYTRRYGYNFTDGSTIEFKLENFFHPFVGELIEKLNRESLKGLYDPNFHEGLLMEFFDNYYNSIAGGIADLNEDIKKEIDLNVGGPYANYNWELLYHIPIAIAVHLSNNQRFSDAQKWFHLIFDPTNNDTSEDIPLRFWRFLKFREGSDHTQMDDLLRILQTPNDELEGTEGNLNDIKDDILKGYDKIRDNPFKPHLVARTRHVSYQYYVVMKYLDNLIAWGDNLFLQDTIESLNEATQCYVMAANILGKKPEKIPRFGKSRPYSFFELNRMDSLNFDKIGNAIIDLEGLFPIDFRNAGNTNDENPNPLFGIAKSLYFCIPQNKKMLTYWDTVADRLFKIRHCMNIKGVVRQLALFDPPLDPGMLAKAVAAGISIGSVIAGLNQPVGPLRSMSVIQKALELCNEVRNLGSALLSAFEKGDSEHLALIRQDHEIKIQQMQQDVRFLQWKQAEESTASLLKSRESVLEKYKYYQRLLDLTPSTDQVLEASALEALVLERKELGEENFDEIYHALVTNFDKSISIAELPELKLKKEGKLKLNKNEYADLNEYADRALAARISAAGVEASAAVLSFLPGFDIKAAFWGVGGQTGMPIGEFYSNAGRALSSGLNIWAQIEEKNGQSASKTASYERRNDEQIHQNNQAAHELMHIGKQILSSLISEQVAKHEYELTKKQIEYSQELSNIMHEKFSNEELYIWMQGELSRLYYEYYRFAFDTARKAEKTMKHELMRPELDANDFIKFNYWDTGHKGLLVGEALHLDIKRMEMAYHDNNKHEFELTKNISLRQLNPIALLNLKANGSCEVELPEWLFDLDGAGQYMRRIKNVSISIPSVTGPYTSVCCTLTILRSSIRTSSTSQVEYGRQGSEDSRFIDYYSSVQSIITSNANNDAGMFETNLKDERFLPFEGHGVISRWKLELPKDYRQFDYNTISDVIIHVRYTSREGGKALRDKAVTNIDEIFPVQGESGLEYMLSMKHDYAMEWSRFINTDSPLVVKLHRNQLPYFLKDKDITVNKLKILIIDNLNLSDPVVVDSGFITGDLNDTNNPELEIKITDDLVEKDDKKHVFMILEYSAT